MTCAADILAALDSDKPTDEGGIDAFLTLIAADVTQAVIDYVTASVTTACAYTGAVAGAGTGTFTMLTATLMSTPFKAGLKATTDVNNAIAQGFANGLKAMICAGTVTEAASGVTVPAGNPIDFTGVGSVHIAVVPAHAACAAVLGRMTSEKPADGTVPRDEEVKKLKLMANSFAKIIDAFIPTIAIATTGAGAVGAGTAITGTPAADPTFPA